MSENKAINVAVPPAVAERLRREAFEDRVSQGSVVAHALTLMWAKREAGERLAEDFAPENQR